jgi:alkylhydroperoxidase family enzyme
MARAAAPWAARAGAVRCAIAEKLSATAPHVTVEDWDALRSLGFDEMGCLEVAHIVGIFN